MKKEKKKDKITYDRIINELSLAIFAFGLPLWILFFIYLFSFNKNDKTYISLTSELKYSAIALILVLLIYLYRTKIKSKVKIKNKKINLKPVFFITLIITIIIFFFGIHINSRNNDDIVFVRIKEIKKDKLIVYREYIHDDEVVFEIDKPYFIKYTDGESIEVKYKNNIRDSKCVIPSYYGDRLIKIAIILFIILIVLFLMFI